MALIKVLLVSQCCGLLSMYTKVIDPSWFFQVLMSFR